MAECPVCQHQNPAGARFCPSCGTALQPAARAEARKVVSVVFVDIVGFTSRAERLDVEDVRALLVPYHALVRRELERHSGVVEKFIGDAVVAVFGAPVAHEDDAERAVRAALAVREAVAAADAEQGLDLHVRIGITTGEALVDLAARAGAGEAMVAGDVINTASRLQSAAPADGILVAQATERATRDQILYRPAGERSLAGKAEPVPVWEALRARSRRGEDVRRQHGTPLVDRQGDRAQLVAAFERARERRRIELVTIAGVAGIGKSRLVRELFDHVEELPELIPWRQGRTLPYGDGVTFAALTDMVKAHTGTLESDTAEAIAAKLERAVAAVVADRAEARWICRQLRPLVGLESVADVRGDRRAEAFGAWRRFFEAVAARAPLVLVFEDLQWADDDLLAFIDHLLGWVAGVPMLVVCTLRFELLERHPPWLEAGASTTLLTLRPLSAQETEALVRAILGGGSLPERTRAALAGHAEGNPLFAHEYVRMLVDQGRLRRRGDEWHMEEAAELPVPESLVAIIAARLDTLAEEEKALLQDAAVVGRRLWLGAVAAVAGRSRWAVAEVLRRLERRELLRRVPDARVVGETEYVFQHVLIRDVAYGETVRAERAEKHRRAAQWIESLSGDRRDHAETLAHHYETALACATAAGQDTADLRPLAVRALREAAERALALHSYAPAAGFAARALELCSADAPERPGLLLARGLALAMTDAPAVEALEQAARALLAAGERERAAEALSTIGWIHATAGRLEPAARRDEEALALCRGQPPSRARALVALRAASHLVFTPEGRPRGLRLVSDGLAIARQLGLTELEAEALQYRGLARIDAGDGDGLADLEHAVATAAQTGSPLMLSCHGNLTDVRRRLGRLAEAAELHERGLLLAQRFGVPTQVRRFRVEQLVACYYAGRWDEALALADDYLAAIDAGSPHHGEVDARIVRARIRAGRGDPAGALRDARAALAYARQNGEEFDLLPALAYHARAAWLEERDRARRSAAELLERLQSGQPMWVGWTLPDVLPVVAELGRLEELRLAIADARPRAAWYAAAEAWIEGDARAAAACYADMGARPEEADARLRAGRLAREAGAGELVERELAPARAFYRAVGATARLQDADALAAAAI